MTEETLARGESGMLTLSASSDCTISATKGDEPIIVQGTRKPEPGDGLAKLRIVQPTYSPRSTRVWLNGMDLSSFLQSISLEWNGMDITQANLMIAVGSVEIDAVSVVNLVAATKDPLVIEEAIRTLKRAKVDLE